MLDLKDKKILSELELQARMNLSELGKKLNISKQTTKYRLKKLEENEIIQEYNAIIDVSKIGLEIFIIYLKLFKITSNKENEWMKNIEENQHVISIGRNTGIWI